MNLAAACKSLEKGMKHNWQSHPKAGTVTQAEGKKARKLLPLANPTLEVPSKATSGTGP
jgi:hypothetical protein